MPTYRAARGARDLLPPETPSWRELAREIARAHAAHRHGVGQA